MQIINKKNIKSRFGKNFTTYNCEAVIQKEIATRLSDVLHNYESDFNRILEIGCGTGFLTQRILNRFPVKEYILNDIVDSAFKEVELLTSDINFHNYKFISGDAEVTSFPNCIDAVISSSCFHWFNNIETFIEKTHHLLNHSGIIAFSSFGEENLHEIKAVTNIGLQYKTLNELTDLMNPHFDILYSDEWNQQLQFKSPFDVLKHIKLTGVNSLSNGYFGKTELTRFTDKYLQLFSNRDKTVNLTYHPIIIIARRKQVTAKNYMEKPDILVNHHSTEAWHK